MSAKLSNCFLALAVAGFLMLFSLLVGHAQNSTVNLAGTEWSSGTHIIPTNNTDNSVTTLTRSLVFYRQGKVEATVTRSKSAGIKTELVSDYVYNASTGRYDYQSVYKSVPTFSETTPQSWQGTYEVRGKSIYLSFPAFTISATIYDNSMKCLVTYKETNEKEEWKLSPLTSSEDQDQPVTKTPTKPKTKPDFNAVVGKWKGKWIEDVEDGINVLSAKMELKSFTEANTIQGAITWKLESTSYSSLKAKVGLTGIEFVRGRYDPETRTLFLEGYRMDDPYVIAGLLEKYRWKFSEDGNSLTGGTWDFGDWNGRFSLTRE